jgi:hypothetical protein
MIAFDVYLNGKKLCRAGFKEFGDLCAHINWRCGPHVKLATGFQHRFQLAELLVAGTNVRYKSMKAPHLKRGFEYGEGPEWVKRKLKVGDELSIRIVETDSVDKPRERTVEYQTKILNLRAHKSYVRGVAKEYGWKVQF